MREKGEAKIAAVRRDMTGSYLPASHGKFVCQ